MSSQTRPSREKWVDRNLRGERKLGRKGEREEEREKGRERKDGRGEEK